MPALLETDAISTRQWDDEIVGASPVRMEVSTVSFHTA